MFFPQPFLSPMSYKVVLLLLLLALFLFLFLLLLLSLAYSHCAIVAGGVQSSSSSLSSFVVRHSSSSTCHFLLLSRCIVVSRCFVLFRVAVLVLVHVVVVFTACISDFLSRFLKRDGGCCAPKSYLVYLYLSSVIVYIFSHSPRYCTTTNS